MNNEDLGPSEVIQMPLSEFEARFGFRPIDALEKKHFAITGKRITPFIREAIAAGVLGETRLDDVVMSDIKPPTEQT